LQKNLSQSFVIWDSVGMTANFRTEHACTPFDILRFQTSRVEKKSFLTMAFLHRKSCHDATKLYIVTHENNTLQWFATMAMNGEQ